METIQKNPEKSHSALLFGPGIDKSAIAKYLCYSCSDTFDWNYIELTPGLFLDEGPDKIISTANRIFKRLSRVKNAVILFDAVDQLIRKRGEGKNQGKDAWVTLALLPHFYALKSQKGIKFILATDRIHEVDPAIMRYGNVDFVLPVGGIHWTGRIKLLNDEIKNNKEKSNKGKPSVHNQVMDEFAVSLGLSDLKEVIDTPILTLEKVAPYRKSITDEAKFEKLEIFLQRTNYVSADTLKYILRKILEGQMSLEDISKRRLFEIFFTDSKDAEKECEHFEEPLLKKFQADLKSKNNLGDLMRTETGKDEQIIKENVF
jgi:SpoVK/Ycf46/Vps4 family AAA+-type ATPase